MRKRNMSTRQHGAKSTLLWFGLVALCSTTCWYSYHPRTGLVRAQPQTQQITMTRNVHHRKLVQVHPDKVIPDCYVVEVSRLQDLDPLLQDYYPAVTPTAVYQQALRGFAACFPDTLLQLLLDDNRVKRIGQDGTLVQEQERPLLPGQQSPAPFHLDRLDGELDDTYTYALDGTGVTVYVMDSGTRATHQEFQDRLDAECFAPGLALCHRDDNSHGTHIAGIIGGVTYGVAKHVTLHTVRVRDAQNELSWSNIYAGFDYIVNRTKAVPHKAIANLSITGEANAQADAAAQNVIDAGVMLVVAAGNQDGDACNRSPARLPAVVAVGATDFPPDLDGGEDIRRDLSNTGPCVTLWAPGSDIQSAGIADDTAWKYMSGTSMSAPVVAGALALYAQAGLGVADMVAQATWIDALADENTTGLFLSIQKLNEQILSAPPPSQAPSIPPTITPLLEMPSTQPTLLTPTTISGPAQGMTIPMDADKTDATSHASLRCLCRPTGTIVIGLFVALATFFV